jgi:hypothetical protein
LATKTGWPDEIPSSSAVPSGDFARMEMLSFMRLRLNWKKTTLEVELAKVEEAIDHSNELMDGIASGLMTGNIVDSDLAHDEILKDSAAPSSEIACHFDGGFFGRHVLCEHRRQS